MQRRGVIFDLDGTLADTLDDITDAINETFLEADLPEQSPARIRSLVGHGLRELLGRAAETDDPDRVDALVRDYRHAYLKRLVRRTRLYPGVSTLLDALVAGNVPMSVLSNKPHEYTAPICEELLGRWPFVRWTGALDERGRKPDPGMALALAAQMELAPEVVYFIGDSPTDVMTARNAGMPSVAVTWGYRDRPALEAARPDRIVDTLDELRLALLPEG